MTEEDIGQWQHMFQELIREVKPWHKWTLRPDKDLLPDGLKPGWTQYQQKTFARFHCSSCSRSWASGRVLIVFHMRWCEKKTKGQVKMRAFAQRCNQCSDPPFATPEFTWDNISRILNNLLFRILKKCYKEGFKQMGEIPLVGDTSLEGPHDSSNCEACLLGFCAQNDLGQASKPPAPPLSPTSSKSTREPKVTATCSNAPCSKSSSKVEKPQASKVNPHASNPTKDDPKVSCTSKPSTTPRLTIQQLSVESLPAPRCVIQMPSPVDSSRAAHVTNKSTKSKTLESLRSSSLYAPPTSSDAPPTSSLYVPSTSSYVPKVSCTSKPSTTPRLTIQQLSVVSSPAPRCVLQMPSPVDSSRAAHVTNKTPESLRSSSLYAPSTSSDAPPTSSLYVPSTSSYVPPTSSSYVVPISSSWRPPVNSTSQVERSSHIHPQSQSSCCKACCGACCGVCGACCEGCCEIIWRCCACYYEIFKGCCNCMSESPLCCLVFLILLLLLWCLL